MHMSVSVSASLFCLLFYALILLLSHPLTVKSSLMPTKLEAKNCHLLRLKQIQDLPVAFVNQATTIFGQSSRISKVRQQKHSVKRAYKQ